MNYLKRIALILLLFIVLGLIISIFLPSSFHMERKIIIDADKEQVFNQLNDLKNWKNWTAWALKDPLVYDDESAYSNPSKGEGATFIWNSSNDEVGSGKLKIVESKSHEYIKTEIDFGFINSESEFTINNTTEGLEIVWMMNIDFGFNPVTKFFGLFMEGQIAPDYELGLKRLKAFAEELPKINSVKVTKAIIDLQWYLSLRDTVNQTEMNNIHGEMFAQINQFMEENGIEIANPPLVVYHFWTDSIIDIEAGIPIIDSIEIKHNKIWLNKIKAGNVVTAIHYGPYERLIETYDGINEWFRKNKVVPIGPPWESYITDPALEPNPEKWKTAIYFPIE